MDIELSARTHLLKCLAQVAFLRLLAEGVFSSVQEGARLQIEDYLRAVNDTADCLQPLREAISAGNHGELVEAAERLTEKVERLEATANQLVTYPDEYRCAMFLGAQEQVVSDLSKLPELLRSAASAQDLAQTPWGTFGPHDTTSSSLEAQTLVGPTKKVEM